MLKLTDSQQVLLKVSGKSLAGNAAPLENVVVTSSDETVATVTGDNEVGFTIASTGKVGTSQISVVADAKIGPDVKEVTGVETIEVIAGEAAILDLTFGEPSEKA